MTSPDSLERPMVSGSVPSGSSSPAFGPLVMTIRDTESVVAAPPLEADGCGLDAAIGAVAAARATGAAAGDGAGSGIRRTFTPNRSARSEYTTANTKNH